MKKLQGLIGLAISVSALGLATTNLTASAGNPASKNGNPCIDDICIHDRPEDLKNIKWESVRLTGRKNSFYRGIGNPAAVELIRQYLATGSIDAKGLAAISKVNGFCGKNSSLVARYIDKKGRPVGVEFEFVPVDGGKQQKFMVTKVGLKLTNELSLTEEQNRNLAEQIEQKYVGFPIMVSLKRDRSAVYLTSFGYRHLVLESQFHDIKTYSMDSPYEKLPGCSPKIDL
jgi:hypothetical protein